MALVTPDTKLCEVIVDEPSVVPVINRFDIVLGVGDRTIKSICKEKSTFKTIKPRLNKSGRISEIYSKS